MAAKPLFRNPLSALVLALLATAGWAFLTRGFAPGEAGEGPAPDCRGISEAECLALQTGQMEVAGGTEGTSLMARPATEACVDVGYLCAEIDDSGSVLFWRWPLDTSMIRVWIPLPTGVTPARATALQRAAVRGVRAWNRHPIPLSVRTRTQGEPPDVTLRWVQSLAETRLGRTEVEWTRNEAGVRIRVLDFSLVTHDPFDPQRELTPEEVEMVATHEMGHVLGLPHSDEPRDVMFPRNTAAHLTARDFRTLEALYDLPNGIEIRR